MQNPFDQFDAQPAPRVPGIIRGAPAQPTALQLAEEQRKREDQARQQAQFEQSQQVSALDIQRKQRDLVPGADTTESEKTAGFLATRISGGIGELQSIYQRNQSAQSPKLGVEITRGLFGDTAANYANDADRQQAETAELDILDAALTLGTGAAYTREQLIGYSKSYFPRLGDAPETIAAKQDRLVRLLEAAKVKAGRSAPMIDEALAAARSATEDDPELVEFKTNPNLVVGMDGRIYDKRTGQPVETPDPNDPNGLGDALYAGVGDLAQGAGELLGFVGNPLNAGINAIAGTNLSTDLGQTFRDATGAPDGNPVASAINRGGVMALTGAGTAALARPIASGVGTAVTNALAQQPIRQGVGGMAAGGSAEIANQMGAPVPVQVAAGLAGGMAGYGAAGLPNALMAGRTAPVGNQAVSDAAQARISLMTTDAVPPRTRLGKTARALGELIPVAGTSGRRVAQQEERVDAVRRIARDFEIDDASIDDVAKDLTATRAKELSGLTAQKEQILQNVTTPAPAPRAIAMLDEQIATASRVKTDASKALVAKLQNFKTALQQGDNTLTELEAIRKEMGEAFKDPSLANIQRAGEKAVKAVYAPLKADMFDHIRQTAGGETARQWRVANARLAGMAGELESSALKSTLRRAESTPEDVAKLLFSAKPSQVRLLYNNLSSEGRAKAQSVIIGKAMEKAANGADVSPDKFANEVDRLAKSVGVFFQDADLVRVQGLARTLQLTKRAQQASVQPETGAQLVPWAVPTVFSYFMGPAGAFGTAGAFGVGARIYESAAVRNALLKLGRSRPGSKQETIAMQSVVSALSAANENTTMQQFLNGAPGLSRAAASEGNDVSEERPIQPQR